MATMDNGVLEKWLTGLKDLDIQVKTMFGCYCVYCDAQPVGRLSGEMFSLKEVGLQILPKELKRPKPIDSIHEIPIPLDYCRAEWLPNAVQATADILKQNKTNKKKS